MAIPASISSFLDRNHIRYSRVSHPIAYTAQEEAAAAHVPGRVWAKSVVCMADDHPVIAVLPAPARIDLQRLKDVVHARSLRLAREDEFEGLYSDCELGAMPPLGPLYRQPVYVDQSLTTSPEIAFNAGSHGDAIRMRYREFQRLVRPTVAAFGTAPGSLAVRASADAVTDTVCGRRVVPERAWGRSEYREETYYFCSQHCKMEFDDNPQAYSRADP